MALAAAVLGYSYSGKPLSLSYHGLGEIQVGIMFGPMLMCGVYYAAVGYLEPPIVFVSIPVGILVANILYAHSIMDFEPDKKAGKVTLAVLLEKREKMLSLCAAMLILAYLSIAYALGAGYLPKRYAVVFISVPLAAALYKSLRRYVQNPSEVPAKRFWMGPMGHWDRISAAGIQWFMIRWFMARNLLSLFCILIIIVNCLGKKLTERRACLKFLCLFSLLLAWRQRQKQKLSRRLTIPIIRLLLCRGSRCTSRFFMTPHWALKIMQK